MTRSPGDYERLVALAGDRRARFGPLGLFLHDALEHPGYAAPTNLRAFAGTGGDGVCFCFVADGAGDARVDGPVVMLVPTLPREVVVGETLRDFLALGVWVGFFALEQLTDQGYGFAERLGEVDALAAELVGAFSLVPWRRPVARLEELQSLFAPGPRATHPAPTPPDPVAFWEGVIAVEEARHPRDEAAIAHMKARLAEVRRAVGAK